MLEAMRRNTKVILWITIIFFLLLIFLVWGADLQFGSGAQPNLAGKINGEVISLAEYQQVLSANRSNARTQGRELTPSDELYLEEQAWNSIVEETLLRQEAERLGLIAHDAEIRTVLLNSPPAIITQDPSFQTPDGRFDLASYRAIIQSPTTPETYLLQLEAYVRATLPMSKLRNLVTSAVKVTDDELRRAYVEQNETASVTTVLIDGASPGTDEAVTDDQLQDYLTAHADRYRQPKRVTLRYVSVPRIATAADSAALRTDLEEIAAASRRAAAAAATGQENLDDSDFITNIITFSDGANAEEGGLRTEYSPLSALSPAFRQAVEGLETGQISDPFLELGFYHLVRVDSTRVNEDGETEVLLRDLALKIDASDDTILEERERLEQLRLDAETGSLIEAAGQHGLSVNEIPNVTEGGIVPGLTALPQAATFAHRNPEGTVSRLLSTNSAWIIMEVGPARPAGPATLDEVRDQVRADLLRDRRLDSARGIVDRVHAAVRGGMALEEAAAQDSLTVNTSPGVTRRSGIIGLGRPPEVLGAVFSMPVGRVSDPIRTDRGWVLLRVDSRDPVDWGAFEAQKPTLEQTLLFSKQARAYTAFLEDLREKASIDDLRS